MPTFTIDLYPSDTKRLRLVVRQAGISPEDALLSHVKGALEKEAPKCAGVGRYSGATGYVRRRRLQYSFFDPALADPSRVEEYPTSEQRLNAIAKG